MNKYDPKSHSSYSNERFPKRVITGGNEDRFKKFTAEHETKKSNYVFFSVGSWEKNTNSTQTHSFTTV